MSVIYIKAAPSDGPSLTDIFFNPTQSSLILFINMPKTWSKPLLTILKSNSQAWGDAKDKSERNLVVQAVADAIKDKLTVDDEIDDLPDGLDDVCVLLTCWQ
jgi:hypothetical protein